MNYIYIFPLFCKGTIHRFGKTRKLLHVITKLLKKLLEKTLHIAKTSMNGKAAAPEIASVQEGERILKVFRSGLPLSRVQAFAMLQCASCVR